MGFVMKKILITLLLMLSLPVTVMAADSCQDMMTRIRAGEKIPSQKWWDCLQADAKKQVVANLIGMIGERDGITINSSAAYYVAEIDAFRSETPGLKEASIKFLLKIIAAMSYDYDEGIPREKTMKKYSTPECAQAIIELRSQEGTPDGRMPKKMMANASFKALLEKISQEGELALA
jgi:hypothetical protein